MEKKIPSHAEVKQIFNDTYNKFYLKWKDIQDKDDFIAMWDEAKVISKKHDCDLCESMIINLCKVIEHEFLQRRSE